MKSSESVVCLFALTVWLIFIGVMAIMISPWCLLVLLIGFKCNKTDTKNTKPSKNDKKDSDEL